MASTNGLRFTTRFKLLGGILVDRFQHIEALLAVPAAGHAQQAPVEQGLKCINDPFSAANVEIAYGLRVLQAIATDKHRQSCEQGLFVGCEQVVAPLRSFCAEFAGALAGQSRRP